MKTHHWIIAVVALGGLVTWDGAARAQQYDPYAQPAAQPGRSGISFGFGVGGGNMSCESTGDRDVCDGVTEAGGADVHVGYMLRPRLAVDGEVWVMAHTEDLLTVTHTVSTVGARYWLLPRLWVRGGIGASVARWAYKGPLGLSLSDSTESVPAVMAAVGYEVLVGRRFALDIQLRGGTGFYEDQQAKARNVAVSAGFNWY